MIAELVETLTRRGRAAAHPRAEDRIGTNVLIQVFDHEGREVARRRSHNLVVVNGCKLAANRLVSGTPKVVRYMSLGHNGGTAPASGQTDVLTIITGARETCDTADMSGTRTAKFINTWGTTAFSATGVAEAGLFNQLTSGAGTMLARVTFTAINKSNSDTLKITWTVKFTTS